MYIWAQDTWRCISARHEKFYQNSVNFFLYFFIERKVLDDDIMHELDELLLSMAVAENLVGPRAAPVTHRPLLEDAGAELQTWQVSRPVQSPPCKQLLPPTDRRQTTVASQQIHKTKQKISRYIRFDHTRGFRDKINSIFGSEIDDIFWRFYKHEFIVSLMKPHKYRLCQTTSTKTCRVGHLMPLNTKLIYVPE